MLNKDVLINSLIIVLLAIVQVFVFNHIQVAGKYNPLVFLMFLLFLPANTSFTKMCINVFCMGLAVDILMGTLGINAFCSLMLLLLREFLLHRLFSKGSDAFLQFSDLSFLQMFMYIFSISMGYNILLYSIESFNLPNLLLAIKEGSLNGLVTFLFIIIFYLLFRNKITR